MLRLEHSGNFRNLFLNFPAKPGLSTAPQYSTSEARAPHSPPAQYQQSQGSPQPPPAQYQQSQGSPQQNQRSQGSHSPPSPPQCSIRHQGPSRGLPASLQCQKKLQATRDHHRDCLPLSSARRSSQPPGTITGTACLSPVPEEAPSHQGPSRGLPASL